MSATIATHPGPCSFSMVVISGSPWRISRASRPERSRFRGIGRATRFRCLRFRPEELSPRTGKYGESTCASRQTCCRTRSCLSTRFMGGRRVGHAGRIRHSIARLRQLSLARRPDVVFARTSNGSSEVRSPPCRRQDPPEQHPHQQRSSRVSRKQR